MKNKIIFLDIDGVLNGYGFWSCFGWKIACLTHNETIKEWYRKISDPCGVHENKVKLLSKIVNATSAKIVMSSSWRSAFWKIPYEKKNPDLKKLSDLFDKYNITVIGITPRINIGKRADEINAYISEHKNEIDNFIILDDERFDLECFAKQASENKLLLDTLPESKTLTIVSPTIPNDLINEGLHMGHCVGTYVERYASGTSKIFFVRKKDDVEKSYVTIELNKYNKLVQARGFCNSSPDKEVLKFIDNWVNTL